MLRTEISAMSAHAAALIVYRYDKGGVWTNPTAYYEIVVRDLRGQLVLAGDDKIEAQDKLVRSLADPPSAIIAREMLRKFRQVLGADGAIR